jgi:hypothetical protein
MIAFEGPAEEERPVVVVGSIQPLGQWVLMPEDAEAKVLGIVRELLVNCGAGRGPASALVVQFHLADIVS